MLKKYRQVSAIFTDTDTTSRYHKNRPIPPIPILKYRYIPTSDKEKARILAWRQEKVTITVICEWSGRGKATITRLLAAAKELPNGTVPKHKFGGGRRRHLN